MEGKPIQSRRIRKPNSVNSIESIQLTWQTESGEREVESYKLIRGSVVWPHESLPGIVLLGGQRLGSDQLIISEERPFQSISEAVEVFNELWSYSPSRYYSEESQENEGFINFLRKTKGLQGKIPFVPALHPDAVDFGNHLIGNFLDSGRLVIPSNGILMTQIQEGRQDTSIEEVYGITALRYLLAGINERPWEEELIEIDLEQCFA
jgi:hypothetical protein